MPIRVLHLCDPFNPGGTQWWLIDIAKSLPRDEYVQDFVCCGNEVGTRVDEIRALGCSVSAVRPSLEEVFQGRALRHIIRHGHYDIVHAHMFNLSGWLLRHAYAEGVGVRIAHFHNTNDGRRWSPVLFLRRAISREMIRIHANAVMACSRAALASAPRLRGSFANEVIACGIETEKYKAQTRSPGLRRSLGISEDAAVIGHVGRFVTQKNHKGLIEILKLLRRAVPNVCLVLVGDGPLKPAIEKQVASSGLSAHARFLGARTDVDRILPAFDAFCFPSLYEGLPIAVLEARMAGLPVVASAIPQIEEALAGCNGGTLVEPESYREFASALASYLSNGKRISPPKDWVSQFSRECSANRLASLYSELLRANRCGTPSSAVVTHASSTPTSAHTQMQRLPE
jgi:glycosyltransferase EpsF